MRFFTTLMSPGVGGKTGLGRPLVAVSLKFIVINFAAIALAVPVGAQQPSPAPAVPTEAEETAMYKTYKNAPKTSLPAPTAGNMILEPAIRARRSVRSFADKPLKLAQVSQLLLSAYGITQRRGDEDHRSVPSAGAMFPLDLYLLAHHVDSLAPGLYHFQVLDSTLELIKTGDFSEQIHEASNGQSTVGASPATLIITATYGRITPRYSDRGYQYTHMEVGAVCQNVYLQATSLGLGTCAVGAFDDDAVSRLLELGRRREIPMLVMPVGVPRGE